MCVMPARAASDTEVLRGFNLTVFGSEIAPFGLQANYIRKFKGEVKFKIHALSKRNRTREISRFINSLESKIRGLRVRIVEQQENANFNLYIVDRDDYARTVREKVNRRRYSKVLGKCVVRSIFNRSGILRSDAAIVSDLGDALFRRCMIEEILQGLGPLNDNNSLPESIFNDASNHTSFTSFDRLILNMLYDQRIKNGAQQRTVNKILPNVLTDVRRRFGQ